MKLKALVIITLLTLCTTLAFAATQPQNLVCEPAEGVTSVEVETRHGENTTYTTVSYGNFDENGNSILFSLEGYEPGAYFFRARFIDTSGWKGEWCEPFKAVKSGKPEKLTIK